MTRQYPQSSTYLQLRRKARRGVILFVVTVVIALASLAAYGFVLTMQGENLAAHASADQIQLSHVAASGEEFMAAWLRKSREARWSDTQMNGAAIFSQQVIAPFQSDDASVAGQFHIVIRQTQADATQADSFTVDESPLAYQPFRYGFVNESGKLHLQTLLAWDEEWPGSGRNALQQLPGMTEQIADAILDWVDSDDVPREFGAEGEYYQSLPQPYEPMNAVPSSLEDLVRVRGITDVPLGEDDGNVPSAPTNIGAASTQTIPLADQPLAPWQDFLTVHSAERNEMFNGQPRIYCNDADLASLHRALLVELPTELAQFVILYRQYGPATDSDSESELEQVSEIALDLSKPASYQLTSLAELVTAIVHVPALANDMIDSGSDDDKSKHIASPLSAGSALETQVDQWLDRLTVYEEDVIVGRLNVLAARPEVLNGLPLTDPTIATQILARGKQGNNSEASAAGWIPGTSWLLAEGVVDNDEFRQLEPYLTSGGDVIRFQVVAAHAESPLFHRLEVILDGTFKNTQRVHFRDLRRFGTPELFDMFSQRSDLVSGTLVTDAESLFAPRTKRDVRGANSN